MEENIWRGKIFFAKEKEREGIIWRSKIYVFFPEEKKSVKGKGGKYLEKENISLWRRRKMEKE